MALLISFQILFNLGTIAVVLWFVFQKREALPAADVAVNSLESDWRKDWELERENFQQQLAVQLRSVKLLNEQTRKLLEEKQAAWPSIPPSIEESEIKNLLLEKPSSVIPTLAEFEAQKEKLIQENPLDLKSLLTQQLS